MRLQRGRKPPPGQSVSTKLLLGIRMSENTNNTRGQHHLPQFLLKGFASRSRKKEVFTWLFRKDGAINEANVKGIAKGRDFYGKPEESDIEQRLSEMEDRFARLVRRLRDGEGLNEKLLLCQFVASTQIRTANVRSGVAEATESFMEGFGEALTTPEYQAVLAQHAFDGAMKQIADGSLDGVLNLIPAEKREQVLVELVPGMKQYLKTVIGGARAEFERHVPSLTDPKTFKDSQNRLLSKNLPPEPRVEHLMQLDWSVIPCEDELLILGDVGVVAGSATGELMHILRHDPDLDAIYLPIASNRLLVGCREGVTMTSVAALNAASAELSREFFISARKDLPTDLQGQIGRKATLLPDNEIKVIMRQSFDGLSNPKNRSDEKTIVVNRLQEED